MGSTPGHKPHFSVRHLSDRVVHSHVPLSASSVIWYWPTGQRYSVFRCYCSQVLNAPRQPDSTPSLCQLHLLPVRQQITYTLSVLTFKIPVLTLWRLPNIVTPAASLASCKSTLNNHLFNKTFRPICSYTCPLCPSTSEVTTMWHFINFIIMIIIIIDYKGRSSIILWAWKVTVDNYFQIQLFQERTVYVHIMKFVKVCKLFPEHTGRFACVEQLIHCTDVSTLSECTEICEWLSI